MRPDLDRTFSGQSAGRESGGRPTRATDPTLPVTVLWPHRDDNPYPLWLVPGDWSRGRAVAHVARDEGEPFVSFRAHRVYLRWQFGAWDAAGWQFEDGALLACEPTDQDAERYWQITMAHQEVTAA